jgi:hypothetical protein
MTDPHAALAALLQSYEEQLLQPATRSNPAAVAALLADDFREFGSSGRTFTRSEILAELASESPRTLTLDNFACTTPAPDVALVTYRSTRATPDGTRTLANRSSLWIFRDSRWQLLFHQGTSI